MAGRSTRKRNNGRALSLGRAVSDIALDLTEGALQALETRTIQRDGMLAIPTQTVSPSEGAQFHTEALRLVAYQRHFEHMIWSVLGNSRNNLLGHVILPPSAGGIGGNTVCLIDSLPVCLLHYTVLKMVFNIIP
jgi:hypothetical protein